MAGQKRNRYNWRENVLSERRIIWVLKRDGQEIARIDQENDLLRVSMFVYGESDRCFSTQLRRLVRITKKMSGVKVPRMVIRNNNWLRRSVVNAGFMQVSAYEYVWRR